MNKLSKLLFCLTKLQTQALSNQQITKMLFSQLKPNQLHFVASNTFFGGKKKDSDKKEPTKDQSNPSSSDTQSETAPKTEKQEQKQESPNKIAEEIKKTDNIEKLLNMADTDANEKVKQLVQKLEQKLKEAQQKQQHSESDYQKLEKSFTDLQKKATELRSNLSSTLEDVELTRKRLTKEKEDAKVFGIQKFAKEMLEVSDNLGMALENNKQLANQQNDLFEGTSLTYRVLSQALKKNGVEIDNPLNMKFNPNLHEALVQVDDPSKEAGTIAFVAQIGYSLQGRVLRPAKVGVVKKQPTPEKEATQEKKPEEDIKKKK